MILDPDAPSRHRPRMRNLIHQLTVNIPGNDMNSADHVAPYMGAGPPAGSGFHRLTCLVYKQSSRVDTSKLPGFRFFQRGGYLVGKIEETLQQAGSGELTLIAMTLFKTQYDDYVPQFYAEQLGYFAYPMSYIMKLLMW